MGSILNNIIKSSTSSNSIVNLLNDGRKLVSDLSNNNNGIPGVVRTILSNSIISNKLNSLFNESINSIEERLGSTSNYNPDEIVYILENTKLKYLNTIDLVNSLSSGDGIISKKEKNSISSVLSNAIDVASGRKSFINATMDILTNNKSDIELKLKRMLPRNVNKTIDNSIDIINKINNPSNTIKNIFNNKTEEYSNKVIGSTGESLNRLFNGSLPTEPDQYKEYYKNNRSDDKYKLSYTRGYYGELTLGSYHAWNVEIYPYIHRDTDHIVPSLIYYKVPVMNHQVRSSTGSTHEVISSLLLPVTNFNYSEQATELDSMRMYSGSSIDIPTVTKLSKSISLTIIEDSKYSVRQWLEKYKSHIYVDNRVRPYKECCSKIVLTVLDLQRRKVFSKSYLGIPSGIDSSIRGLDSPNAESVDITFSVVGEIPDETINEQFINYYDNNATDF